MTNPVQDPARIARRRREHERQAVVFGVLVALLVVAGLGALAIYTGAITAPFARGFTPSSPEDDVTPPCLPVVEGQPDGALPLAHAEVHVRILNATGADGTAGVAGANRTVLSARGFVIDSVGDYDGTLTHSELRFGEQGIIAAYTLAAQFPQMRMVLDTREDATVDFLVGTRFDEPLDEDQVNTGPLTNQEGCVPASEITKIPAPNPTATEGEGEGDGGGEGEGEQPAEG